MAPGIGGLRDFLPAVRGGRRDWDPHGLWVRGELRTETVELDLVGRVGPLAEVAVYGGRGGRQVDCSG